jgi:HEAT repeat protein
VDPGSQTDDKEAPSRHAVAQLPAGFFALPYRERRAVVSRIAYRRSIRRTSTREVIAHTYTDGDPSAVGPLAVALELDPDVVVKRSAAFGLSCIPLKTVVPALRGALTSKDRATKGHAIHALGRLRAREAVPDLVLLLDDWYAGLTAADALVSIEDEHALEPMRRAAARGPRFRRRRLQQRVWALESAVTNHKSA